MIPLSNGWLHSHILSAKGGENIEAALKPNQIKAIEDMAQENKLTFDEALQTLVDAGRILFKNIKEAER